VQGRGHPQEHDHKQVDGLPHTHHQQHRGHHGLGRQRQHRAAIRHAVVIGSDQRMALDIQAMPASEAVLTSKPAFVG